MFHYVKYIGAIIIVLAVTTANAAKTCNGGTMVNATDNTQYCKSPAKMNWWSAESWCQSNGRHLVSETTLCGPNGMASCDASRFSGIGFGFWILKLRPANWSYFYGGYGAPSWLGRAAEGYYFALCE